MVPLVGILLFVVAVLVMYFLGKMFPVLVKISSLALLLWLLSILLSVTSGIDAPQKALESIPMVQYIVTFVAGAQVGGIVADFI